MRRIEKKFAELKEVNKKALITFTTAGDPDLGTTKKIVAEMIKNGADIVELGIPYSDPIAEGPVIQRANKRALMNNIKIQDIFNLVIELRLKYKVNIPLVFLLYYNCVLQYGDELFFKTCKETGIDGIIIPDLPYEERSEIDDIAEKYDIDLITLVSPTSKERIEKIASDSKGFLYCVSSLGVTGVRSEFQTDFEKFFSYVDKYANIPTALGFGISTPEHIKKLKIYCDGLIVGSAIVKIVEENGKEICADKVGEYVSSLRSAMDI